MVNISTTSLPGSPPSCTIRARGVPIVQCYTENIHTLNIIINRKREQYFFRSSLAIYDRNNFVCVDYRVNLKIRSDFFKGPYIYEYGNESSRKNRVALCHFLKSFTLKVLAKFKVNNKIAK